MKIENKENSEWNIGARVGVISEQVFATCDQYGTVMRVFKTTLKVKLDSGSNWFISKHHCWHLDSPLLDKN